MTGLGHITHLTTETTAVEPRALALSLPTGELPVGSTKTTTSQVSETLEVDLEVVSKLLKDRAAQQA